MKADYGDDAARSSIYSLLDTSFAGLSERIRIAERRGSARGVYATRAPPARRLAEDDVDDVHRLHELLRRRAPVSNVIASLDSGWLFRIDEVLASRGLRRLWYADDLDALLAFEVQNGTLMLFDVVAEEVPSLAAVLECIPFAFGRVELQFTPERAWSGRFDCVPSDPTYTLMVRGDFPIDVPFMLSPLARCRMGTRFRVEPVRDRLRLEGID